MYFKSYRIPHARNIWINFAQDKSIIAIDFACAHNYVFFELDTSVLYPRFSITKWIEKAESCLWSCLYQIIEFKIPSLFTPMNQNAPSVGFDSVIAIENTQIRNYDKTDVNSPFLRGFGRHFGRFRTSVALGLGLCLWVSYTPTTSALHYTPTTSTLHYTPTTSTLHYTPTTSTLHYTLTTSPLHYTPTTSTLHLHFIVDEGFLMSHSPITLYPPKEAKRTAPSDGIGCQYRYKEWDQR